MDITVLYNILEKYGWPGILCIILVIALYYVVKWQSNKTYKSLDATIATMNKDITSTITAQNDKLLDGLKEANKTMLDYIIRGNDEKHAESINHRLDAEEMIDDRLHDMVNMYQANRVAVIEFHNSKENLDGLSFVWYDIHYEKFNKGTQDIMMQVQNQPSSILLPIVKRLRTSEYVLLTKEDIENIFDEGPVLYNQLNKIPDLNTIMYFGLYNDDNKLIALVVIEWHKEIDVKFIKEHLISMHSDTAYISSLINIKKQ